MSYTNLHIHTSKGSRLDGVSSCDDYAKVAKDLGHTHLAVTDHGSCASFWDLQVACNEHDLKPIFGLEAYVVPELVTTDKKTEKRIRTKNSHAILLAKNDIGYKNILKLNYISNSDTEHFFYKNRITRKELFKHSEGIICGTACLASEFAKALAVSDDEFEKVFMEYYDAFGEDFYVEVQMNELTEADPEKGLDISQKDYNHNMINMAEKMGVPIVLTSDTHYATAEGFKIQTLSIMIAQKQTIKGNGFGSFIEAKNLFYHTLEDYKRFNTEFEYNYSDEELELWYHNSGKIAEKCTCILPERNKILLPEITEDDDSALVKDSMAGLKKKLGVKEIPKEYKDRLIVELELLLRKGFASYSLILADMFAFLEKNDTFVGPARGSAGGSLVMYALGITKLDPMKFDLIFERFLSDSRCCDVVYDYFGE